MNILIHYFDKKTILMFMANPQIQENTNLCFVFLKRIKNHFYFYIFFLLEMHKHFYFGCVCTYKTTFLFFF